MCVCVCVCVYCMVIYCTYIVKCCPAQVVTCGVWHGACIPGVYDVMLPHTGATVEELPFGEPDGCYEER